MQNLEYSFIHLPRNSFIYLLTHLSNQLLTHSSFHSIPPLHTSIPLKKSKVLESIYLPTQIYIPAPSPPSFALTSSISFFFFLFSFPLFLFPFSPKPNKNQAMRSSEQLSEKPFPPHHPSPTFLFEIYYMSNHTLY